jgi:hypothetical protein
MVNSEIVSILEEPVAFIFWVEKCYGENNVHDMENGQQKSAARSGMQDRSPDKASTDSN